MSFTFFWIYFLTTHQQWSLFRSFIHSHLIKRSNELGKNSQPSSLWVRISQIIFIQYEELPWNICVYRWTSNNEWNSSWIKENYYTKIKIHSIFLCVLLDYPVIIFRLFVRRAHWVRNIKKNWRECKEEWKSS